MPDKKLYSSTNGNGANRTQPHDDAYWAKLRDEFRRGQHQHSGAYCASAHPRKERSLLDEKTYPHSV